MAKIIKAYTPITAGFQEKDEVLVPMIIDEYIDKVGTGLVGPYICVVNEKPISRKHWGSLVVQKNDVVLFLGFPQGGGEGGSNPIKSIAMIAVMAAAMTIPGAAIFAGTMFAAGTFGGALMSGAIMFGGSYLLNLAFPPQAPEQVSESTRSGTSLSSYNINDRGNNSALQKVITVQYGRMKHYPKYAMQSWSEYIDNEQYAYLLFCQGQGEYEFEEFNFGTVPSDELSNIEINIFDNDKTIKLNSDGSDWTHKTQAGSYSDDFEAVSKRQLICIAVGELGEIQVSDDNGDTWTQKTPAGSYASTFRGVAINSDVAVIVGNSGEIQVSDDNGDTWTQKTAAGSFSGFFRAIATDGDIFIVVGSSGEIQVSDDNGDTWTQKTPAGSFTDSFYCVFYGNGRWVVGGDNGEIQVSDDDGDTWTQKTPDDDYGTRGGTFTGATYGDSTWVLCGPPGRATTGEIQISDDNGDTWIHKDVAEGGRSFFGAGYTGKAFVVVGNSGEIQVSVDRGLSWERQSPDDSYTSVFNGAYEDIIVGNSGEIQVATGGTHFYDNVFTSDQVQNIEVKRVDEYTVNVPGSVIDRVTSVSGDQLFATTLGFQGDGSKYGVWTEDEDGRCRQTGQRRHLYPPPAERLPD